MNLEALLHTDLNVGQLLKLKFVFLHVAHNWDQNLELQSNRPTHKIKWQWLTYSDLVLATIRLYTQDSKRLWSTRTLLESSVKGLIFLNQYYLVKEKRKPELFLFGYFEEWKYRLPGWHKWCFFAVKLHLWELMCKLSQWIGINS